MEASVKQDLIKSDPPSNFTSAAFGKSDPPSNFTSAAFGKSEGIEKTLESFLREFHTKFIDTDEYKAIIPELLAISNDVERMSFLKEKAATLPLYSNLLGLYHETIAKNISEAIIWYGVASKGNNLSATNNLAKLYLQSGDYKKAEELLITAAKKNYEPSQLELARYYSGKNNHKEAKVWYEAVAKKGNITGIEGVTETLIILGELKEAQVWLEKFISTGTVYAKTIGALCYAKLGDTEKSEKLLETLCKQGDMLPHYLSARFYISKNEYGTARVYLQRAINSPNLKTDEEKMNVYYLMGLVNDEQGDDKTAEEWYHKSAKLGHMISLNNIGLIYIKRGMLKEAEKWFVAALVKEKNSIIEQNLIDLREHLSMKDEKKNLKK